MEIAEKLNKRINNLILTVIRATRAFPVNYEYKVIKGQLIRSICSVGANYRAACRARSTKEFYAKLCIVVEEMDESVYWIELLTEITSRPKSYLEILKESEELLAMLSKSRRTVKMRLQANKRKQ